MQNSTEAAGIPAYTIQRAYIHDTAQIAVGIRRGELTINIGEVALVMTPEKVRELGSEMSIARLIHDMKYLEDDGRSLK